MGSSARPVPTGTPDLTVLSSTGVVRDSLPPFLCSAGVQQQPCPCRCLQVAAMGCRAFALLFDDIDPCMCQADREAFPSLAQAQASVANEVYQELGQPPVFLFCPTGTACSPRCSASRSTLSRAGCPLAAFTHVH